MNLESEIIYVKGLESTKSIWRIKHTSDEFLRASNLSLKLMGEHLNKTSKCGCVEDLFLMLHSLSKDKIKLKQIQMENKFKLNKLITFKSGHYSPANITDVKSIEILTKHPKFITAFSEYPENWKEICGGKPELTAREVELFDMEIPELFAIAQELYDEDDSLRMPGARSREKTLVKFIIENEVK